MNKNPHLFFALLFVFGVVSCNSESIGYNISITNPSSLKRESETIEIHFSQLAGLSTENTDQICIIDHSGKKLLTQLVDHNFDSMADYLIFQADFNARETRQFTLRPNCGDEAASEDSIKTFCRFVPERIDDFAWENDRVAFRTYGPKCQQMFEAGTPGGLISSGIDCWLKRVEYPSYDAGGFPVSEHKTFTIDLGTNFYRCEVTYDCLESVEQAAIGIAHHDKEGEITFNMADGWLSYWEPQDDSFLGTAIILDSGTLSNNKSGSRTDSDNHWITLKTDGNSFSYQAGFGWEKGGQFSSSSEWNEFAKKHAKLERTPLIIQIEKQ